ncbi:ABC transporter permease [Patescibacteria group bacterium]|nr:ABC transporter permease [Patescibacteria group bacterium]
MFLLNLTRIIKFSFQNFYRNFWLSLVTITIIILTLFSLTSLIVLNAAADNAILTIKDKIDISIYFDPGADEQQVKLIKQNIEKYEQVKEVKFISAEQALSKFKKFHENDELIQESLAELDENPLGPTLTIKSENVNLYPEILTQIHQDKIDELAQDIDYDDHKLVIQKIEYVGQKIRTFGLVVSGLFALIALLVVFNTIRIGIYTHREEIGIMKLVGASNWFIRLPFLLEGVLYATISSIVFWIIFYLIAGVLQPIFYNFFIDINFNLMSYISSYFVYIFGFELIIIIVLNTISSFIAIGKYLRV